jgi:tRNA-2-methylthio-N6-dimethylallyladenosine synthase
MSDEVPHEAKAARLKRLQDLVTKQAESLSTRLPGSIQRVLVESVSRKNSEELAGRMDNNRIVNFAGSPRMLGRFVDVKITTAWSYTMRGEVVTK